MSEYEKKFKSDIVVHTINPIYDAHSQVLLLGTLPSPKSRERGFYYAHPQNRFWRVMSIVLSYPEIISHNNVSNEEKTKLLLDKNIALWDVLHSAEISGAADSTIKGETPNDLSRIFNAASIKAVFATGTKAAALYKKHQLKTTKIPIITLPSTSPANCAFNLDKLVEKYGSIKNYLL